jgi:hypothetical protein
MSTLTALISSGSPTQEGGIPVNSVQRFELNGQVMYTDEYDQEWLKSGNVIFPEAGQYPYALRTSAAVDLSTNTTVATAPFGQSGGWSMQFSSDGTKLYISDNSYAVSPYSAASNRSTAIHQYSLSTPFDPTTKIPDNKLLDTRGVAPLYTAANGGISGFSFAAGGTKLYLLNVTDYTVYQYTLSTAWDISTASYDDKSIVINNINSISRGLFVKEDGASLYVVGSTTPDQILQYNFGTAYDVSTATYSTQKDITAQSTASWLALDFSIDGTKCYAVTNAGTVYQYNLSTPWAINTASYSNNSFAISPTNILPFGINISPDGTKFFSITLQGNINIANLTTAYNISTYVYDKVAFYAMAFVFTPASYTAQMTEDGTAIYFSNYGPYIGTSTTRWSVIFKFLLTTPYDLTTMLYDGYYQIPDAVGNFCFFINQTGTKLYLSQTNTIIRQYSITTPWDLSTLVYDNIEVTITTGTVASYGINSIFISPDGTFMWLGTYNSTQTSSTYTLSTPFDVSTYTLYQNIINFANLSFSPDGTSVFYVGFSGIIRSELLGTPYKRIGGDTYNGQVAASIVGGQTLDGNNSSSGWKVIYSPPLNKWYIIGALDNDRGLAYGWNYSPLKVGVTTSSGTLDYIRIN